MFERTNEPLSAKFARGRTRDAVALVNSFTTFLRVEFILNRNHVLHTFSWRHGAVLPLLVVPEFAHRLNHRLLGLVITWMTKQVDRCDIFEWTEHLVVSRFFISVN
jgi:hypothetical protein